MTDVITLRDTTSTHKKTTSIIPNPLRTLFLHLLYINKFIWKTTYFHVVVDILLLSDSTETTVELLFQTLVNVV